MAVKSTKAGGLPSIKSTVNELIKSKQVRQNMLNLYKVNKHKGFDCPGCAWETKKTVHSDFAKTVQKRWHGNRQR